MQQHNALRRSVVVTSSGTGVGKTFISSCIARHVYVEGYRVVPVKPFIAGALPSSFTPGHADLNDTVALLEAAGLPVTDQTVDAVSPWRFALPLAPPYAAEMEGVMPPSFEDVVAFCTALLESPDYNLFLLEGVGGVMSPITRYHTMLDLISALRIPVLLVEGTYLGSISHTLTTLEVLHNRRMNIQGVVVSESLQPAMPLAYHLDALSGLMPDYPLVGVPYYPEGVASAQVHYDLGQLVLVPW